MIEEKFRPRRRKLEHPFQKACAKFLHHALPPEPEAWFTSIDHATVSEQEGQDRKARGAKPGIGDELILWRPKKRTIWIELKWGKNDTSDDQDKFADLVRGVDHFYHVARSMEEVELILRSHGMELRATTMTPLQIDAALAARAAAPPKAAGKPRALRPTASVIKRSHLVRGRIQH